MRYTQRDHETLAAIRSLIPDGQSEGKVTNKALADKLGLTGGATAPRVFRLRDMGVIDLRYKVNPENGYVDYRIIQILRYPDGPEKTQKALKDERRAQRQAEKAAQAEEAVDTAPEVEGEGWPAMDLIEANEPPVDPWEQDPAGLPAT